MQRRKVAFQVPEGFAYETLLEIPACRSYLKSFSKETKRWNELIEATLCYGIHCLSSNFSLHALRVSDINEITGEIMKPAKRYYARKPREKHGAKTRKRLSVSPQRRSKPSNMWRAGEETHILKPRYHTDGEESETETPTIPKGKQEIDCYNSILGEKIVDAAWKCFGSAGYPNRPVSASISKDSYTKELAPTVKKYLSTLPEIDPELDRLSFAEYLRGFLQSTIKESVIDPSSSHITPEIRVPPSFMEGLSNSKPSPVKQNKPKEKKKPKGLEGGVPVYLKDVKSKVRDEHQQRRKQVLRVRKNQTQKMKEAIAKQRIREYEERQAEGKKGTRFTRRTSPKKGPPGSHAGTAALEIADSFAYGGLMNKFRASSSSGEDHDSSARENVEIYGRNGLSEPDGCAVEKKTKTTKQKAYTGWVGDFGPPHTRTLKPREVWDYDDDENDEFLRSAARRARRGPSSDAWDFDEIEKAAEETKRAEAVKSSSSTEVNWETHLNLDDDDDGILSDLSSEEEKIDHDSDHDEEDESLVFESDPAFSWLRP